MPGSENIVRIQELFAKVLLRITDTVAAANNVLVHREHFADVANMVDRMKPILLELKNRNVHNSSEALSLGLCDLGACIDKALTILQSNRSRSICLLLLKSPEILKEVQDITHQIGSSLDRLSVASLDVSLDTRAKMADLCETMMKAELKAAVETEGITSKLKEAFQEEHINSQHAVKVLLEIAEVTGASMSPSFVEREIEAIKKEKADLEEGKLQVEKIYLEQVIAFLYRSDMVPPSGMSSHLNEGIPMPSFCCKITGKLMEDPVDIQSGKTFERKAIQDWFDQGHKTCPVTNEPLESFALHPNINLSDSIKEWKERNAISRLEKAAAALYNLEDICKVDGTQLSELCQLISNVTDTATINVLLIPCLVTLSRRVNEVTIRTKAMECLASLAQKSSRNKILITNEDVVKVAVDCLDEDDIGLQSQGVALLLELSKEPTVCDTIGKARNCILLLVALISSRDMHLANTADEVLENLSRVRDTLTFITQANHFKPLVSKLTQGSVDDKVEMANLLGQTQLTDYSRASLLKEGILVPLVHMLSETNPGANLAALTALQNLSKHSNIRDELLATNVVKPLLELLQSREAPYNRCSEMAADILAYLFVSKRSTETNGCANLKVMEIKETIKSLVVLLATTVIPYSMKGHLLQILLGIATIKTASNAREELRNAGTIRLLLSLCDERNTAMKLSTVKLLNTLAEDGNGGCLVECLEEKHVRNFVIALKGSVIEEKVAVLGILSNLPTSDSHIIDLLLRTQTLPAVMELLSKESSSPSSNSDHLIENALGVFLLFTSSPRSHVLQQLTEFETIDMLVHSLDSGTALAKQRAATAMAQLSKNTISLSGPAPRTRSFNMFFCLGRNDTDVCRVHGKICSAKESFCLVEAKAIDPLLKTLGERECCADAAALDALDTLLGSETWGPGMKALKEAGGLKPIVHLLTEGSPKAQERVLQVLERMTLHKENCELIGKAGLRELIQLMQQGSTAVRKDAAKILRNLGEIPPQSDYF